MTRLEDLEDLVRIGEFANVSREITQLNTKKIDRTDAARLANIAHRVEQNQWALRLLYPIVRAEKELDQKPSSAELIEYSEALRRLGLINEAMEVLKQIDMKLSPSALLPLSFCYFNQWRYSEAIPLLQQLTESESSPLYLRTVANVNLAAALVHEEREARH